MSLQAFVAAANQVKAAVAQVEKLAGIDLDTYQGSVYVNMTIRQGQAPATSADFHFELPRDADVLKSLRDVALEMGSKEAMNHMLASRDVVDQLSPRLKPKPANEQQQAST